MEQDVVRFIEAGASRPEALAAVMVAVAKNYLNKVVGNRHRSRKRIMFQGATARNKALVAAFERLLDVEVVVSPYCHVMGAFGVARLVRQTMAEQRLTQSRFRGSISTNARSPCARRPAISARTTAPSPLRHRGGAGLALVGLHVRPRSGRAESAQEPYDRALRLRQRLWREGGAGVKVPDNAPVIGLPQALLTTPTIRCGSVSSHAGFPRAAVRPDHRRDPRAGPRMAGADFCFPAKLALAMWPSWR